MKTKFGPPAFTGPIDYKQELAAMKRTAARARKDPAYAQKLFAMHPMFTRNGQLKKQFR